MKVEGIIQLPTAYKTPPHEEIPVIDEKVIKSILYLGVRGDIKMQPEKEHTVDTFA
jgi:hypothetical protein